MSRAERIYDLVKVMPEEQIAEVLDFVELLGQKAQLKSGASSQRAIPRGTLTGLRGIAKRSGTSVTDEELRDEYTEYLNQKYQ
jgi:Protein of unknown function (DUF2281)